MRFPSNYEIFVRRTLIAFVAQPVTFRRSGRLLIVPGWKRIDSIADALSQLVFSLQPLARDDKSFPTDFDSCVQNPEKVFQRRFRRPS